MFYIPISMYTIAQSETNYSKYVCHTHMHSNYIYKSTGHPCSSNYVSNRTTPREDECSSSLCLL